MAYGKLKADTLVYDNSGSDTEVTISSLGNKAGLASPAFTGTPTAPTAAGSTNTTQIATTAYVQTELGDYATLAAPALTGTATGVNLTLSGNLTVNGTTTTINSTTLTVDDKNIDLGNVDTPSDTTADGGGITLKGASDKTITWVNSTDAWTFNQNVDVTGTFKATPAKNANNDGFEIVPANGTTASSFKILGNNNGGADGRNGCATFIDVNYYATTSDVFNIKGRGTQLFKIVGSGDATFSATVSDSKGDVRSIPQNHKTSAYVLIASDAGKCIKITTGGITVNNSVFSSGDAVTIVNHSGSDQTITQGSSFTLHNSADATTGNRTLAGRGMATIWFENNDQGYISGAGLS